MVGNATPIAPPTATSMVKVCFTLLENRIAEPGTKTLHLQVMNEAGEVLAGEQSERTTANGTPISATRQIDYSNERVEACIFYIPQRCARRGSLRHPVDGRRRNHRECSVGLELRHLSISEGHLESTLHCSHDHRPSLGHEYNRTRPLGRNACGHSPRKTIPKSSCAIGVGIDLKSTSLAGL